MLSVTPISAAQAGTYYAQTDGYYSEQATAPSHWYGRGAEHLGLSGRVEPETFRHLLNGRSPDGSAQLVAGSQAHDGAHRAGYDLTFSAPKSVSVLALVGDDPRLVQAHDEAARATLAYAESRYAETRHYRDGTQQRIPTGNWVSATFRHETSRELDPQLHTHAVVLNLTQRQDGHWRAITGEKLLEAKMELGAIYRNELAARVQQLGYRVDWGERGMWEIKGVGQDTIAAFSRRSEQIQAAVEQLRTQYPAVEESKLREWATLGSRQPKQVGIDQDMLRQAWRDRAELAQGQDLQTLIAEARERNRGVESGHRAGGPHTSDLAAGRGAHLSSHDARDIARLAAERLAESESVFTRQQWMQTASQLAAGKATTAELDRAMDDLSKGRRERADVPFLRLRADGEPLYTTHAIYRAERDVLAYVRAGRGRAEAVMTEEKAEALLNRLDLSEDQRAAAKGILTTRDRLVLIQGDAGTGKTTMLRAVREAAEAEGWTVRGLAYTGQAANELREAAGIQAETAHRTLAQLAEQPSRTTGKQVWVVDENSMLGSRQMNELIDRAREAQAKLVLVGDTKQLPSIGAGRLFAELQERQAAETYVLHEVKRQRDPSYREVVELAADKRIADAFARLARDGRLHEYARTGTREEREAATAQIHQTMAVAYADRVRAGHEVLAVSLYREDARQLNAAIRTELQRRGLVATDSHAWQVREPKSLGPTEKGFAASYQSSDTLVCLVSHRDQEGHGWQPGTVATVRAVDPSSNTLTVALATRSGTPEIRQIHLTATIRPDGKQQADGFVAYESRFVEFARGETVVFLKNDRQFDVRNGQRGQILEVSDRHMTVRLSDGTIKSFGRSEYNYLTHGYAVTDFKSQGATAQHVLIHADAGQQPRPNAEGHLAPPRANYQSLYVALTRGREDVQVYTPDVEQLRAHASMELRKTSSLEPDRLEADAPDRTTPQPSAGLAAATAAPIASREPDDRPHQIQDRGDAVAGDRALIQQERG
jgi:conjugative relaxase-like TrwC/TraI family protein